MYNIKKEFNHINKEFKLFVNDQPKNFEIIMKEEGKLSIQSVYEK